MKIAWIAVALGLVGCAGTSESTSGTLIIGDSISLGYTPYVQEVTTGVVHNPDCTLEPFSKGGSMDNGEGSSHQAACINQWLDEGHYSVVHFNAGIWDSRCESNQKSNLSDYLNNLQIEIDAIREHGATPIFATTTPAPMPNSVCADESVIETYNAAAVEMMKSQGIQVDDLFTLMSRHNNLHKAPDNVHWVVQGYKIMAAQVALSIKRVSEAGSQ